jgi:hypothetical protein
MDAAEPDVIPLVGHSFELDFGEVAYHNTFDSDTRLTFKPVRGAVGEAQTVSYTSVDVHRNAYFQFWQEKDSTTVSRFIDLGRGVVHGNITLPDHTFLTLQGTVRSID